MSRWTVLCLLFCLVSIQSLCITNTNCGSCVAASSSVGTACVYCMDQHECHDPATAVFKQGCTKIQFNSLQCGAGTFVNPTDGQRVITYDTSFSGYEAHMFSTSLTDEGANVIEMAMIKGHWLVLSDYNNYPAVVLRALSSSSNVGSEYFAFAFVPRSVQEWNDSNSDGQVQVGELVGTPYRFNDDGYSWAFANSQDTPPLYSISITGTQTNFPTLTIECKLSDKFSTYQGVNMTGSTVKCDISVTGLQLSNTQNSWVARFFFVGKTRNIFLTGEPVRALANAAAGRAGKGIDIGAGGFVSWVNTAGSASLAGTNINVVFAGIAAASTQWGGKSFVDAVEATFGFPNPNPGSNYDIYWDPVLSAPEQSSASSLAVAMASVVVLLLLTLFA